MKWLQFILSHSIFIAFCAVALCWQSFVLLHLPINTLLCVFVFFATLASYNFYWLAGKFSAAKNKAIPVFFKANYSYATILFISGCVVLYLMMWLKEVWLMIIVAGILTVLYSSPLWSRYAASVARRTGFFKTILLSFTWAFVTAWLPATQGLPDPGHWLLPLLLFAARFFFMLMLCLIFDMRDIQVDKMHALHSLATDLGTRALGIIMLASFSLYMLAGIALRYLQGDSRQLVAHAVTGIITWYVYRSSRKPQGYVFYYFLVDGLMLISALATLLAAI